MTQQSCAMVPRWRFFGEFLCAVFSASRVQHISDMHLKFALRPHHVWKYGRHPICDGWDKVRNKDTSQVFSGFDQLFFEVTTKIHCWYSVVLASYSIVINMALVSDSRLTGS